MIITPEERQCLSIVHKQLRSGSAAKTFNPAWMLSALDALAAAESDAAQARAERDEANLVCVLLAGRLQGFKFCPSKTPCTEEANHFDCVKCICEWAGEAAKEGGE